MSFYAVFMSFCVRHFLNFNIFLYKNSASFSKIYDDLVIKNRKIYDLVKKTY